MFKERNTKLTLLSLLSALVVLSTAFAGVSIYAQQVDNNTTSTEDNGLADNATSLNSSSEDFGDNGVNASETSTAASVADIFSGLVVCDLGTLTVNDPTELAADLNGTTPTITITVMDRTEIAAATENDTSTAANDTSSADCMELGETSASNETSTSNATESTGNATSDNGNATSTSNATSLGDASLDDEELTTFEEEALLGNESGNATSAANATDTSSNATSVADAASTSEDEGQIAAIDGEDFAPGQVVLVFTDNALVAIDDVDEDGSIDAKVPLEDVGSELRFVESGTMRTATASFAEGDTQEEAVIAGSEDQDIHIMMAGDSEEDTETADLTGNATSTSSSNATITNSAATNSMDEK